MSSGMESDRQGDFGPRTDPCGHRVSLAADLIPNRDFPSPGMMWGRLPLPSRNPACVSVHLPFNLLGLWHPLQERLKIRGDLAEPDPAPRPPTKRSPVKGASPRETNSGSERVNCGRDKANGSGTQAPVTQEAPVPDKPRNLELLGAPPPRALATEPSGSQEACRPDLRPTAGRAGESGIQTNFPPLQREGIAGARSRWVINRRKTRTAHANPPSEKALRQAPHRPAAPGKHGKLPAVESSVSCLGQLHRMGPAPTDTVSFGCGGKYARIPAQT